MASRKQPALSNRVAGWSVLVVVPGGNPTFTGSNQVVKRVIVPANATGILRLYWNNGSSFAITVTGSGGFTIEPEGQYDFDYGFQVDCGLITAGQVAVEFCEL